MSLITPDFGLIFWTVVIFAIVFFILAKFGFPIITAMVEKRSNHIADSLKAAEEATRKLERLSAQQQELIREARLEQGRILQEASEERERIVRKAKDEATAEAAKIVQQARAQIAAERENAVQDIRSRVAAISVDVAEKIIRTRLEDGEAQAALLSKLVDEASENRLSN